MAEIDPIQALSEMRRLMAQPLTAEAGSADGDFAALLKASVNGVNEAQATASEMAAAFERGDPDVSLPAVMIAIQKAGLAFQAMTEVRNRLVSAYQDIMNMPL